MGRGKCQLILLLGHFFVSVHSGQDSFQLSHFTNYFRSTPEGYDQKWNPEASRNFDSEVRKFQFLTSDGMNLMGELVAMYYMLLQISQKSLLFMAFENPP